MKTERLYKTVPGMLLLWLLLTTVALAAEREPDEAFDFDDAPMSTPTEHPEWFTESFLDLSDDLEEALAAGKKGSSSILVSATALTAKS